MRLQKPYSSFENLKKIKIIKFDIFSKLLYNIYIKDRK